MDSNTDDSDITVKKQPNSLYFFNLITSDVKLFSSLGDFIIDTFPTSYFTSEYDYIDSDLNNDDFHAIAQTLESYRIHDNNRFCIYPILCCEKINRENFRGISVSSLKMPSDQFYIVPKHIARANKHKNYVFPCYPKYDDKGNLIGFKELCRFID